MSVRVQRWVAVGAMAMAAGAVLRAGTPAAAQQGNRAAFAQFGLGNPGFGQGTGGIGSGPGFGNGSGPGFGVGSGQGFGRGSQGAALPGGGSFVLASNAGRQLVALCTDLPLDPPTAATRYTGASAGTCVAGDRQVPLSQLLASGDLLLTGDGPSWTSAGEQMGRLALRLRLTNRTGAPVRVELPEGTVFSTGASRSTLPANWQALCSELNRRGETTSNAAQVAVWAAQGNSLETMEQLRMARLSREDTRAAAGILESVGVKQAMERGIGQAAEAFDRGVEQLGPGRRALSGRAAIGITRTADVVIHLPSGTEQASRGWVEVRTPKGGSFRYAAEVTRRSTGTLVAELTDPVSGESPRPARLVVSRARATE